MTAHEEPVRTLCELALVSAEADDHDPITNAVAEFANQVLDVLDHEEDRTMTAPTLPATVDRSAMMQAVRDLLGIDLTYVRSVRLERDEITVESYDVDQDGRARLDATGEAIVTHQITIPVTS